MIVNRQALVGIFTSFNVLFNKAISTSTPTWDKIATKVPSEAGEESYKWLGQIPRMREWIGERQIQNLSAHDYTLKNKDFELTIAVDRNDIEDDKVGIYAPMVASVADSAVTFPDDLVYDLLKEGFANKCYDGKPFFADNHVVGDPKSKSTASNKGTAKLSPASYGEARSAIMSYVDEGGRSLKIVPNLLIVPPALEAEAKRILVADEIAGSTNIYKGTAEVLVAPELAGKDTAWYLVCNTQPLKPLIYQERKAPVLEQKTNPTDDNVFFDKKFVFGVHARGNAGYGFWQMAYGSTGTANA